MSETLYFTPNLLENRKKLSNVQDITSLSLGVGAGILAPSSLHGFLIYLVGFTFSNAVFYAVCCQLKPLEYFRLPLLEIFLENVVRNVPEYIMMWCLVYALVK